MPERPKTTARLVNVNILRIIPTAVTVSLLTAPATVFAQAGGRYGDGGMMGPGIYHFWGMGFFNLAFWILLLIGIVFFLRWLWQSTKKESPPANKNRALDILKERYARGEINREQFESMKKDIEG
jgi:putative membrane protein